MITFSVKNFSKFQHYKDRSPPWIKLYNSTLDDYAFGVLPDASKSHLVAIWLLASRSDNKIPYDADWIARRINATESVDLDALVNAGFIEIDQGVGWDGDGLERDASKPLASGYTREETEAEQSLRQEESSLSKNLSREGYRGNGARHAKVEDDDNLEWQE